MTNEANPGGGATIRVLEQFPDLRTLPPLFDPDNLSAGEVLKIITLALAKTRGADGIARLRAEAVFEEQWARGRQYGLQEGERRGHDKGYFQGVEDGRAEALDKLSREEAERATVKASARARRTA